jgi:hypothetical protein
MPSQMTYRQGDVLIRRVDAIPEALNTVPKDDGRVILAYGEITGHAHAVLGDVQLLAADVEEMELRFLRVEGDMAQVVHEEHGTITLPPGDYEVRRQREHAPEASQMVAD